LGEALGLFWEEIDITQGRLFVKRALQRQQGKGLVFVEPKTDRSRRTVHLSAVAVETLKAHKIRQSELKLWLGPDWQDQRLVFTNTMGGPISHSVVEKAFKAALRKAELPDVRVHDLRHGAATLLLSMGVHPKIVQEMLGHSTITLTLDTYSHTVPALHAEAASQMDKLLGSSKGS
jgi:integrase